MGESQAENSPNLGAVIQTLMQNPDLLEQLKTIGQKAGAASADAPAEVPELSKETAAPESAESDAKSERRWMNQKRERLLCALKPYLSKERAGAIDAAVTFARILDTVRIK